MQVMMTSGVLWKMGTMCMLFEGEEGVSVAADEMDG